MYKRLTMLEKLVYAVRISLAVASILMLWFWISTVWVPVFTYWRATGSYLAPYYRYYALFPVIYLVFVLVSCTRFLPFRLLTKSGAILHLALIAWILVDITHPSFVTKPTTGAAILFAGSWVFLCLRRMKTLD